MIAELIGLSAAETQSEIDRRNRLQTWGFRLFIADALIGFYGFGKNIPGDVESSIPAIVGFGTMIVSISLFSTFSHINQGRIEGLERYLEGEQLSLPEPTLNQHRFSWIHNLLT